MQSPDNHLWEGKDYQIRYGIDGGCHNVDDKRIHASPVFNKRVPCFGDGIAEEDFYEGDDEIEHKVEPYQRVADPVHCLGCHLRREYLYELQQDRQFDKEDA